MSFKGAHFQFISIWLYYIQRKIFFRRSFSLYSPCPNLEGIKDALPYKFRRLTIGQLLCRVHNRGCQGLGAIETHSRAQASGAKRRAFQQACLAGH